MIYDVLIIGGGPAGATTALLLAQAGWSVAIVEKKIFPRRKVCGEFISATNLPLLQKLGIADFYLQNSGPPIQQVGLFAGDAMLVAEMPKLNRSQGKWGRALGREHFDSTLLDRAMQAGAKLWQPWDAKTLRRNLDSFTCVLSNNDQIEEITARMVVMAHGSWERAIIPSNNYPHKATDLLAFKAHFKNSSLSAEMMPLLAFSGGYGGMVHTDGDRVTLSCCIRRAILLQARQKFPKVSAGEAVVQHIMNECLGVRTALDSAQREQNWLAAGPIRPGIRKCYDNGIFFVGNIAGEAHPIVAEGISMAMQSAWLLSQILITRQDALLTGHSSAAAGRAYTQQWSAHFASRIRAAALFAQFAMHPRAVALLLPIFKNFPKLLTYGAKLSGKIRQVVTE